ncbi:mannitol-1-phosphate 5-dehydrogenase [Agrococcus sp. SGAir0287]|uniref:mannitol-1-phosphate 5-dehydrogenase n=1 Tax=Agrococcus sp. SGAir0287 TaxID=2070347 RepID=UPI0010CCC059|nr:mannitol-1-phosphate 5-dehydrogenase [Agrococcus sp. SGAir0287]QCR20055.1 mannitol-1-phosphate 5-dehydrogenase [Agrococcus sp. SGAir0287]
MRAVHFGAGNIGRGFIGLLLHEAGYHVTFVDVNAELIGMLQAVDSYAVTEVGPDARRHVVTGFDAIDSRADEAAAVRAIAEADVVTCAVGPTVLRFIAPVIRAGLAARPDGAAPLAVMACENAIGASDTLAGHVLEGAEELASRAVFANTAVDRIIPAQDASGVDVVVEDFSEWSIDRTPFAGDVPAIDGAHMVDDLTPWIERKLFTVNTGHATTAYHGFLAGAETIADALALPAVRAEVEAALAETSALLVERFGLDADEHAAYVARAIQRFENRALPDTCVRIGRQPLRKLSRDERFIRPAAALAEQGAHPHALVRAVGAALAFDVADDEQAVELQRLLRDLEPAAFVAEVCGIAEGHPLQPALVEVVAAR